MDTDMNEMSGNDAPVPVRNQLEDIAAQGISPDQLLQWYHSVMHQDKKPVHTHQEQDHSLAGPSSDTNKFTCPWCEEQLKYPKDFIRHVEQKCCVTQEYRCFEQGCTKTYRRPDHFKKHHKKGHRCGFRRCTHHQQALVTFMQNGVLGCGFCGHLVDSDLRGYLKHLIGHYREGATLKSWSPGRYVPSANSGSLPPQVTLDPELENYPVSDFSALLSGFGSQAAQQPSRSVSTSHSDNTTLVDATGMTSLYSISANFGPGLGDLDPLRMSSSLDATHYLPQDDTSGGFLY